MTIVIARISSCRLPEICLDEYDEFVVYKLEDLTDKISHG